MPKSALVSLACLAVGFACLPGPKAPEIDPKGTLGMRAQGDFEDEKGPLRVVFASPKGKLDGPSEITVLFNKSMRPLDIAGSEVPFPAKIEPSLEGTWQWTGTRAASFIPARPGGGGAFKLPGATAIKVTIPAGTKALDGEALAEDFSFSFETERPKLVYASPSNRSEGLTPDTKFELFFNLPVSEATLRSKLTLTANSTATSYSLTANPDDARRWVVTPTSPLPLASDIGLDIEKGFQSTEGPLPTEDALGIDVQTYGPLVVRDIACGEIDDGRCAAGSQLVIELSNPVKFKELKGAVSVEPAVKLKWPGWYEDDETVSYVTVSGNFKPGAHYGLRVKDGIVDTYGQKLAKPYDDEVEFGDVDPIARIGVTDGVLEASAKREVTVGHINTHDLAVSTLHLDEDAILAMSDDKDPFEIFSTAVQTTSIGSGRKNILERHKIDVSQVLGGPKARGAFAVDVTYTRGRQKTGDRSTVQLTDLAISAKVSRAGTLVFVSKLADASPMKDVELKIRRPGQAAVATKKTDGDGYAFFASSEFTPSFDENERAVLFARTADDFAYKRIADSVPNWDFSAEDDPLEGLVFDGQGIYRPGETVHVKGIVRAPEDVGSSTPAAATPVEVSLVAPDGEPIAKATASSSSFGTFNADFKVPLSARLGTYWVRAEMGTSTLSERPLEVLEYRAAEFKVGVESDHASYIRGDNAQWSTHGDYLYGAPMAGAKAAIDVARVPTYFAPPNTDGFETTDSDYQAELPSTPGRVSSLVNSDVSLDASGLATASAALAMPGQTGTEAVVCNIDVTDVSRQVISTSTSAVVHPGEFYVGVSLDTVFVDAKTKLSPKFIAVKPSGDRVSGAALSVSLVKRSWANATQGSSGGATTVSAPVDTVISTCDLTSGNAPVSCDLTPPSAGQYFVRVTSADSRKNPVAASMRVWVLGEGAADLAAFYDSDRTDIELVADKDNYLAGETAKILVKSPWKNADALVTIERKGISEHKRVKLAGAAPTIEVPITDSMRPNAYVSVVVLRGRTKTAPKGDKPDVGAPTFRIGYANLTIDPESRRLDVAVSADKQDYRPGDQANVTVTVKDQKKAGARAEVTLMAIDEGVLSLTGYQVPDPIETFGAPRSLHVTTLESRNQLAQMFDPLSGVGIDKGLDGGGGGPSSGAPAARRDFRAAAYYNPSIVTNSDGVANVSFKLPDGLSTYRLMAVAVATDDRFGRGQSSLTTSRPLMARPALPRFLRAGDTFDASVIVSSKTNTPSTVTVKAALAGVVTTGATTQTVTVEPGRSVEVRFPAFAPKVGIASFNFSIDSGDEHDAVELERNVQIPLVMESVAAYGHTAEAAGEKLGDLSAIRDDVGELTLTTASTALVGLDAGSDQILEYPYGCTEQLSSRLVPLVAMKELATDFALKMPPNLDDVVEKTIANILKHQRYDGSFGLWADSPQPNPWVTTYAVWALNQASQKGYKVPSSSLDEAVRYLIAALDNDPIFARYVGPFVLDVLAEMGKPDVGRMSTLFERRQELAVFGKAMLLHAMAISKGDPSSIAALVTDVENAVRIDGPTAMVTENLGDDFTIYLDSPTRTTALALRGLMAARPDHALGAQLAMGLLSARDGGRWRSTQEGAWALLALGDYRKAQEKVEPNFTARTFFGDKMLAEQSFVGRSLAPQSAVVATRELGDKNGTVLAFQVDGAGQLFYQARLRYARKELPKDNIDRGFYVERRYRRVTPDTLDEALATVPSDTIESFSAGDLVLADVVVVTPKPRRFVAVEDPLPAGLEAVDTRLATTSGRLRGVDYVQPDEENQEGSEWSSYFTREVRDDRVLFFVDAMAAGVYRYRYLARATAIGAFVTPPTKAEEMYAPEVFGRTGASTIKVEAQP
ncbi:MAG: MG2 domain-containing protein [Polyangiaceae bacterium]